MTGFDRDVAPPLDRASKEYDWWAKGATAESRCHREGLTGEQRAFLEYLRERARDRPEFGPAELSRDAVYVFTAGWPLRRRVAFAWRLVRAILGK